jgi:hypothetical protein
VVDVGDKRSIPVPSAADCRALDGKLAAIKLAGVSESSLD